MEIQALTINWWHRGTSCRMWDESKERKKAN